MRVFFYQAQARRDDATPTLGVPAAFPSLGVAPRGVYDATAAASGFGTPGPPRPFRPALRVTGNPIPRKAKLARVSRSSLGNGRLPPRRKRTGVSHTPPGHAQQASQQAVTPGFGHARGVAWRGAASQTQTALVVSYRALGWFGLKFGPSAALLQFTRTAPPSGVES